jgi:hypothetical protein
MVWTVTLVVCIAACARKRVNDRAPDDPIGEAGASSLAAGASGESISGGSGGGASGEAGYEADAARPSPQADASAIDSGELPELPGLPAPAPGIAADGELPTGIWIGESSADFNNALDPVFGELPRCKLSSLRITLQIASAGPAENPHSTIVFGANAPVPPVEPAHEYPRGINEEEATCLTYGVLEGFPYTLRDGHIDANGRFDFRVAATEPFDSWCAQQPSLPFHFATTGYTCLPYGLPRDHALCSSDPECAMSLTKYTLCQNACACVEEGCRANLNRAHRFDLQISGEMIHGVVSRVSSYHGPVDVILRKVK